MSKHTKEPWRLWNDGNGIISSASEKFKRGGIALLCTNELISKNESEANASRIVACVNACEGFMTGELETVSHMGETLLDAFDLRNRREADLIAQRDELFKALEKLSGDVEALMKESSGVYGLHQNGDHAPWGDLVAGGRHETWLLSLSDADELIVKVKGGEK